MKLGIGIHHKQTENIPAYLTLVKNAGFTSVFDNCSDTSNVRRLAQWCEECARLGLTFENAHCSLSEVGCWNFHIWEPGAEGDEVLQFLLRDLENCHTCSVPMLVLHVDARSYANNDFQTGKNRFETILERADKYGIKIAIENINCSNYLFRTLEAFPQSGVGFCYDSGHNMCATPEADYSSLFPRLFCCHLHDNHGGEPDEMMSTDEHLLPFDGIVDFPKLMKQMKEAGYTGALTVETNYEKPRYQDVLSFEEFLHEVYLRLRRLEQLFQA